MTISLEGAIIIAARYHADQTDKQGKPYILHPLRVMLNAPAELKVVAVLHDVLEDCDIDLPTLTYHVDDPGTMEILDCLTHRKNEPRSEYIARICTHTSAVMVKVLDIRDNLDRVWGLDNPDRQRLLDKYGRDLHQIVQAGYDATTGLRV